MTWLISDEARKHRAFREVWVAYLLGGLYLLLGLYTEISDQNYSVRYDAQQKWWFVQQNIRSYGATLTAFLLAVGLPRLVCCEHGETISIHIENNTSVRRNKKSEYHL